MVELRLDYDKDLVKNTKIKRAKFSPNLRYHSLQDNCFIKTEAGEINTWCKDCEFCSKSKFSRFCPELGVNGYMHTKDDGLSKMNVNQGGIKFREPMAKIIQRGERWICHNTTAGGRAAIYILTNKIPPCKEEWRILKTKGD